MLGVNADTKPTTYGTNTLFYESDTSDMYIYNGTSWVLYKSASKTETLTNKTVNATNNTITDTSTAAGDLLKSNGTKFSRYGIGTANQVLTVNSGATDLTWTSLGTDNLGTATGTANGSTTAFTIAHSLGTTPYCAFVQVSSVLGSTITFSYTYDATNITVTFASAPASGTITFQWRAVA